MARFLVSLFKKSILLIVIVGLSTYSFGQDSTVLKICTYNLLNYGNYTSGCTTGNNNINNKDNALSTIFSAMQPDLLLVNEIGVSDILGTRILVNTLNVGGVSHYGRASITNTANASISNCVFYNQNVLQLDQAWAVDLSIRDANVYRFFVKEPNLAQHNDTVWLYAAVCHLKAGNSAGDASQRTSMANTLLNALQGYAIDYLVLGGDLNVYNSSEQAYQNLLSHPSQAIRLYDPINTPGNWHANSGFKNIHTQSTRSSGNGCASGGGSDDRFDFLLLNRATLIDSGRIHYQTGTYQAFGQDGNRFNGSINSPTNQAVSATVANALFNSSDHLPVVANLVVKHHTPSALASYASNTLKNLAVVNPMVANELAIVGLLPKQSYMLQVYDTQGRLVLKQNIIAANAQTHRIGGLPWGSGLYWVQLTTPNGLRKTMKVIKN